MNSSGILNLSLASPLVSWVSPEARRQVAFVADRLTPYIAGALGQLPTPLSCAVKRSFEASMLYTGVWEKSCAEASTPHQYFNLFFADAQNPPRLIFLENLDLDHLAENEEQDMELFYMQMGNLMEQLSGVGIKDEDLLPFIDKLKLYYKEFSFRLFHQASERYTSREMGFVVVPADSTLAPLINVFPSAEDEGAIEISINQKFELKNCDEGGPIKGKIVGEINSKAALTFSVDPAERERSSEIMFLPEPVNLPEFEVKNFVNDLQFPDDKKSSFLMPDGNVIQVSGQVITDLHRQWNYVNGVELKENDQIIRAIYALTDSDSTLSEMVCKCLSQATPANGTVELFKKYRSDEVSPLQSRDVSPTYEVMKNEEGMFIRSTVFFNIYSFKENDFIKRNIKMTTVVDFNTGHATIHYLVGDD